MVLHTTYDVLRVPYSCGVVLVFWFWQEIGFDVTYILLSVQYSCAVVSVFLLWWTLNFVQIFLLNDNLRKFLLGFFFLQKQ